MNNREEGEGNQTYVRFERHFFFFFGSCFKLKLLTKTVNLKRDVRAIEIVLRVLLCVKKLKYALIEKQVSFSFFLFLRFQCFFVFSIGKIK